MFTLFISIMGLNREVIEFGTREAAREYVRQYAKAHWHSLSRGDSLLWHILTEEGEYVDSNYSPQYVAANFG